MIDGDFMIEVDEIIRALTEEDGDDEQDSALVKDVQGDPPPKWDFVFQQEGNIYIINPTNQEAYDWLRSVISEDSTWIGRALAVEHRYIADIINGIHQDGWETNVRLRKQGRVAESEEDDDDETIKDILGPDYLEKPPQEQPAAGEIERFGRWADVEIAGNHFCISYLTPVAVFMADGTGARITDRGWSSSTKRHITKWFNHIQLGPDEGYRRYSEIEAEYHKMSQEDLIKLFKQQAARVDWNRRQTKRLDTIRPPAFWKGDYNDRVSVGPKRDVGEAQEEEDEDLPIKDVTEPEELMGGPTDVKRFGRIKVVEMPNYSFLISYLTPVGYHDKISNVYYRTTKHWSPTTEKHIDEWKSLIRKSPEYEKNPNNWEKSEYSEQKYVKYPSFKKRSQQDITALFRALMPKMKMKPHLKRRMYHVDPLMRQGSGVSKSWLSGHLKHHDTGDEGMPRPSDSKFEEFFTDFDPHEPEHWEWGSDASMRDTTPRERYEPDE